MFGADADAEALERLDSRSRQRSSHKGQDAMEASFGRFGSRKDTDLENTPLLRHDGDQEDENDARSGRAPPSWDGERDFEGRPWWNKPSVGYLNSNASIFLTDRLPRSFGFFLLSRSSQWPSAALSFQD